ncbi:prepilin peptidase [Candidatus Woesearchaeota archaeon]|nr:prepilin peptidase [Candidatus Woesearchaeota archaeon]
MIELVFFFIALIALLIATYSDVRTREVPDWINYSLIAAGLGIRIMYSLHYGRLEYIVDGLLGLAIFFAFAYVMFYTGQWGGGDSKCLMGLGALLGIQFRLDSFALSMLINIFVIGAAYGLLYSVVLAVRHWRDFVGEWRALRLTKEFTTLRVVLLLFTFMGIVAGFIVDDLRVRFILFSVLIFFLLLFYTFIFTKAVERSCMHRWTKPEELTEGDWIVHDVIVDGKRVCGPKDLGVSKEQIAELVRLHKKKKLNKILMKVGIPFEPAFLIALIVTWFVGNLFMPVLQLVQ